MSIHRPLPATMRYVAARAPGPPDVLAIAEGPLPIAKPGEVLIEVSHAGVNRPDCAQRAGTYPPPPDASPIIGLEVAGTVVARGEGVTSWDIGDQVCALTPGGGYAEYCTTPAAFCLPIPRGLTLVEAASLPENFFTVWNNLFDRVRPRDRQRPRRTSDHAIVGGLQACDPYRRDGGRRDIAGQGRQRGVGQGAHRRRAARSTLEQDTGDGARRDSAHRAKGEIDREDDSRGSPR